MSAWAAPESGAASLGDARKAEIAFDGRYLDRSACRGRQSDSQNRGDHNPHCHAYSLHPPNDRSSARIRTTRPANAIIAAPKRNIAQD